MATSVSHLKARQRLALVPNGPLRELAVRATKGDCYEPYSWERLAAAVGVGNGTNLRRSLGIAKDHGHARTPYLRTYMRYETAVALVRELGQDPVDYGV